MTSKASLRSAMAGAALLAATVTVRPADACGGFFCSQAAPVNQAAERIVFSRNDDGTVTAVIQILYEGPAENFSWLLPISTVPMGDDIAVASNLAFQRLQNATNPQYTLTTRVEGTCKSDNFGFGGATSAPGASGSGGASGAGGGSDGGVVVEATGIVGSFEWTVISIDQALPDAADAAVDWLETNGYDVSPGARGLLRPYLEDGLFLLALRLTKGSDTGSIRPIVLTYAADRPMIPIKLTAVAANEDMGVMTWLLSEARGVPQNYLALELNEARINWFNPSLNYNDVVTAAANEASGQGFVTEYADQTSTLAEVVWSSFEETEWQSYRSTVFQDFAQLFDTMYFRYGPWDGFWDAVRATVTLPAGVAFADFQLCPNCYSAQLQFSPATFIQAIEDQVIEPVRLMQRLLLSRPYVSRLYTTMSAADMTVDPLFTFNPDLPTVSNLHTAERIIECNSNVLRSEAPWRIELPQGGVIRGAPSPGGGLAWPTATQDQPSNARILRQSESGSGVVVEDNTDQIAMMLDAYNSTVPRPGMGGSGTGGTGATGGNAGNPATSDGDLRASGGGGCAVATRSSVFTGWLTAAAATLLWIRRRRAVRSI